jgi:hypothetical protein
MHATQRPPEWLSVFSRFHDLAIAGFAMLTNLAKLIVTSAILSLAAANADAQRIHPRCAKFNFRDKVGCTCALENGGSIVPRTGGGWRWVSKTSGRQTVNDGFVQCMRRHGRG